MEDTTLCRFEGSNQQSDDVTMLNILQAGRGVGVRVMGEGGAALPRAL